MPGFDTRFAERAITRTLLRVPAPTRALAVTTSRARALVEIRTPKSPRLAARRGEVWVVRPDAHVAAIVGADVTHALRRALERVLTGL